MILDERGIRLDPSDFDGDWDYVYAGRGLEDIRHIKMNKIGI